MQAVAAAPSLAALRTCLAQLENALASEGHPLEEKGKKTRGQAKAESERIPLLSPAWKVIASTPVVKGAWLACSGAEVPAAVVGMEGLLQPVQLVQPAAAPAAAAEPAPAADAASAAAGAAAAAHKPGEVAVKDEHGQQQQDHAQQLALQQQHHAADLEWLPATVAALSLRVAALDAVLQYPQLGPSRMQLYGRQSMARYRWGFAWPWGWQGKHTA